MRINATEQQQFLLHEQKSFDEYAYNAHKSHMPKLRPKNLTLDEDIFHTLKAFVLPLTRYRSVSELLNNAGKKVIREKAAQLRKAKLGAASADAAKITRALAAAFEK